MLLVHLNAPKVSESANGTQTNIQPSTTKDSSNAKLAASASTLIRTLHALHGHPQPHEADHRLCMRAPSWRSDAISWRFVVTTQNLVVVTQPHIEDVGNNRPRIDFQAMAAS